MSLVPVTGWLSRFSRQAIPASMQPELAFRPSHAAQSGGHLMISEPVIATLTTAGAFTAQLEETDAVGIEGFHYIPEVTYYRDGKPVQTDSFWRTPIFVPPGGGDIETFPGTELGAAAMLVQLEDPEPSGYKGYWRHAAPGDPDDGTRTGTSNVYLIY